MNKSRLHIALFVLLGVSFANNIYSQSAPDSAKSKFLSPPEFSVFAGAGRSTLIGFPNVSQFALGGDAGFGYTYFFNTNWGIATGVSVAFFNSKYKLADISGNYRANDGTDGIPEFGDNGGFYFTYATKGFSGQQHLFLANIPVMLQYERYVSEYDKSYKFYLKLGGKIGVPLGDINSINRMEELQTSGTFWGTPIKAPESMGLGTYKNLESPDKIPPPTIAFFASAETGFKWDMKNGKWFYTGIYIDYGINQLLKVSNEPLSIKYNANYRERVDADYQFPDVIVAKPSGKNPFTKTIPVSVGVRVTLAFGHKEREFAKKTEVASPPSSTVVPPAGQIPTPSNRSDTTKVVAKRKVTVTKTQRARVEKMRDMKQLERPITFEFDRFALLDTIKVVIDEKIIAIKKQLDEDVRILKKYPDVTIIIEGHTCDIGPEEHNITLAKDRAEAVKAYLLQNGIPTKTIVNTISKSSAEPRYPNINEENRQKNRRVEIKVVISY
ncbi:hypothetical protein AGMMS49982_12510 [Bacteroidia bacterium]|nr:hypothetical protein AGMMS49982_12510 [Bacteroidia bacterium]